MLAPIRVPIPLQLFAWIAGILACIAGMLNIIGEWDSALATIQFLLLAIAPIAWMVTRRRVPVSNVTSTAESEILRRVLAVFVGLLSLATSYFVGAEMQDLPPAYHDEYSYVFQAKTLLQGRFSVRGSKSFPELFDQMHVLNEGKMASRYYPGTGLWLAPWIAVGHPYWGQWVASALAAIFVFQTGYELGRLRVALIAGVASAVSPGIAIFSNLLLAHQATLLGLTFFLWSFVKWQRTRCSRVLLCAGIGLSYAMLCRPATAAGFGFPFGVVFALWLIGFPKSERAPIGTRFKHLAAIGLPILAGLLVMIAYNRDVTGSLLTSPYQLYTDLYTPRHVYGFNNGIRGDLKKGPKVIEAYDRWAQNLTPELAATNVRDRWVASWLWTFDAVPLLIAVVIAIGTMATCDSRWWAILCAILSLHAIHIPYWYAGIMGWHYVFETAPLWCLVLGLASDTLFRDWRNRQRLLMPVWWGLLLLISLVGIYCPASIASKSLGIQPRIRSAIASIRYPRKNYAKFDKWLESNVNQRPALVLIEVDRDDQHVDYVTNSPGLNDPIVRGRFNRSSMDVTAIAAAFPERTIYLCDPKRQTISQWVPDNKNESTE